MHFLHMSTTLFSARHRAFGNPFLFPSEAKIQFLQPSFCGQAGSYYKVLVSIYLKTERPGALTSFNPVLSGS